jgi:hypothetical protein
MSDQVYFDILCVGIEDGMDSLERDALLQEVTQQNSRLQQLIEAIAQLVARSREVLRRQRPGQRTRG